MLRQIVVLGVLLLGVLLIGCSKNSMPQKLESSIHESETVQTELKPADEDEAFTVKTRIKDIINDPVFDGYGCLIFPVDIQD